MASHGHFHWNELLTDDVERAKKFYAATIGWTFLPLPMENGDIYWVARVGDTPVAGSGERIREELGLSVTTPIVLYTGTFEAYQGLDLLFSAAAYVKQRRPDVRTVLAGGRPDQIDASRAAARAAGRGG